MTRNSIAPGDAMTLQEIKAAIGMERIDSSLFDWQSWRNGSPIEIFGIQCRSDCLVTNADLLRKYAIGYCDGESLPCRPKTNTIAVMFEKNNQRFWFHLFRLEAERIFNV